jgi:hypothetical protein
MKPAVELVWNGHRQKGLRERLGRVKKSSYFSLGAPRFLVITERNFTHSILIKPNDNYSPELRILLQF